MLLVFKSIIALSTRCESCPRYSFSCKKNRSGSNLVSSYRYIHGGIIDDLVGASNTGADEIYILSLPSFHWFQVSYPSLDPRAAHACVIAGSQMILIGGLNPTESECCLTGGFQGSADPWIQGIGIFDLTSLLWKSSYSAVSTYYNPGMIKDYYSSGK